MTTTVRHSESNHTPFLLWPFVALWRLVTGILLLIGRLAALLIGFILLVVGAILTVTVVGAVVGIPLALVGLLLVVRSLY
jgi:hypothetical protein